jgi:hypothetical protein
MNLQRIILRGVYSTSRTCMLNEYTVTLFIPMDFKFASFMRALWSQYQTNYENIKGVF